MYDRDDLESTIEQLDEMLYAAEKIARYAASTGLDQTSNTPWAELMDDLRGEVSAMMDECADRLDALDQQEEREMERQYRRSAL